MLILLSFTACVGVVPTETSQQDVDVFGTKACNETCASSTECGSWCSVCATGSLGSTFGRCYHGLPSLKDGEQFYILP